MPTAFPKTGSAVDTMAQVNRVEKERIGLAASNFKKVTSTSILKEVSRKYCQNHLISSNYYGSSNLNEPQKHTKAETKAQGKTKAKTVLPPVLLLCACGATTDTATWGRFLYSTNGDERIPEGEKCALCVNSVSWLRLT